MTPNTRPNPYIGPRWFKTGEKLYGRDREVRQLSDLLIAERIVLLHSPSGAGKSSLIRAGLIPLLQEDGFRVLPVIRLNLDVPPAVPRPGRVNRYLFSFLLSCEEALPEDQRLPLDQLADISTNLGFLERRARQTFDLLAGLEGAGEGRKGGSQSEVSATPKRIQSLDDYLAQRLKVTAEEDCILIFDQFEETLTLNPHDQEVKATFFAQLGALLRNRKRWALFAMREDYMASLTPYLRPIPTRLANTFRLDLLGAEAAKQALQLPARQAGVNFTDEAAQKLVDDLRRVQAQNLEGVTEEQLGQFVEPVQLQVVGYRLWDSLPSDATAISAENLASVGNVDESLAGYYAGHAAAAAKETGVNERAIREWVEHKLITEQGIRSQVLLGAEQSEGLDNRAIRWLEDAHLIRAEKRGGATWFELTHDRLIRPVKANNAAWFEANLSALQHEAELWHKQNRPEGFLLQGKALAEAEAWAAAHADELTSNERDFLEAGRKGRAAVERERRQAWVMRLLTVAASLAAVVALFFCGLSALATQRAQAEVRTRSTAEAVAVVQSQRAEAQSRLALARELAAASATNLRVDPERSLLLALQAVNATYAFDKTDVPEAEDALHHALPASHLVRTLAGHTDRVYDVAFSPDGQWLATAGGDKVAKVWDAQTGQELVTLSGHTAAVVKVAFSPDGTRVATASQDGSAKVWDAKSGEALLTLSESKGAVLSAAFSPDGARLATASADGTAAVWDAQTGDQLLALSGHEGAVNCVTFSPDGALLATGDEAGTVKVWEAETGAEVHSLAAGGQSILDVAFRPDGAQLATTGQDAMVRLWNVKTGAEADLLPAIHADTIYRVAFSPDGKHLATASADGTAGVWNAEQGGELFALLGHTTAVSSVAYSPDGKRLATASFDKTAKIWDAEAGRELLTIVGPAPFSGVTFSPDGSRLAAGEADGTAQVWDAVSGQEQLTLTGSGAQVNDVVFSRDGARLATADSDGAAKIWDAASGKELLTLTSPGGGVVHSVTFSPDGKQLAMADEDGTAVVWDAVSGESLAILSGHTGAVYSVAFSPDGARLATASADGLAKVWEASSGNEVFTLSGHKDEVSDVVFSPDGTRLATASVDGTVKVWDAASGNELLTLTGHTSSVASVVFSPDGSRLATASFDKTAKVWDAATGQELLTFSGYTYGLHGVAFSPDGAKLAAAGEDATVQVYALKLEDLLALAKAKVTRSLTPQECQKYLHTDQCPAGP